jgi:hypothetical protein
MLPALAAFLALTPAAVAAPPPLRPPAEVAATGFSAKIDDGRVVLTWRRYKRDDFRSYQVVKSTETAPQYPDVHPIFSSEYVDATRFEDGRLDVGTWRYRLCIVTRFGDRWVSPPVTVVIRPEDVKRAPPTEADFE